MRRLNDIKKVADFIVSNFKPNEFEFSYIKDDSIGLNVPYLPANIVTLVCKDIRIGAYPLDKESILINIYKL